MAKDLKVKIRCLKPNKLRRMIIGDAVAVREIYAPPEDEPRYAFVIKWQDNEIAAVPYTLEEMKALVGGWTKVVCDLEGDAAGRLAELGKAEAMAEDMLRFSRE